MAQTPAGPGATDKAFGDFVSRCESIHDGEDRPLAIMRDVAAAMRDLLSGGWTMPDARYRAMQHDAPYGSYLLYASRAHRFVVILDTFASGQTTAVHNHQAWAVVGVVEGREFDEVADVPPDLGGPPRIVETRSNAAGEVSCFPPGAFHRLRTEPGVESVSLHVYGLDVGVERRIAWDEGRGDYVMFTSGYTNASMDLPTYLET